MPVYLRDGMTLSTSGKLLSLFVGCLRSQQHASASPRWYDFVNEWEAGSCCRCLRVAYGPSNMSVYLRDGMTLSTSGKLLSLFEGCLRSQKHASVSKGPICSDNCMCCHTETEVADPTCYLIQSWYTDTGQTSSSTDPITPGTWQGSQ